MYDDQIDCDLKDKKKYQNPRGFEDNAKSRSDAIHKRM